MTDLASKTVSTTARSRRRAAGVYKRRTDADARLNDTKEAICAILNMELHPIIKRSLIKHAIWLLTLAEGSSKHRSRYRTQKVVEQERSGIKNEKLQHDHVYQMSFLIDALLDASSDRKMLLDRAVGCTVTEEEHQRLTMISKNNPDLDGWQRYSRASITVIDTQTGDFLDVAAA